MQFQRKEVGVDYTVEAFEEHEETRAEITGSKGEETNVDDDYLIDKTDVNFYIYLSFQFERPSI